MRVSEAITREVRVATPGQSIRDVAKIMDEINAGAMPVGDNDRLVGMITDREQVRRLPVVNREKRLVGIVSLGNIAQAESRAASKAVKGVTKPGGQHAT